MNKERIRVLIITGAMNVGGIENQLMHLLRQADKEKFQIDFTTTAKHPFYEDEILSLGGKCIHIPSTDGKHFLRYCKTIYRVMKDGKYDIVHSHELFHSGMVLLTAKLAGVKHRFVHAHSSNQEYGKNWKRHLYNRVMRRMILHYATCFLACSTLAGEFLFGKKTLTKPNYHLVVNSVETQKFLPDPSGDPRPVSGADDWKTVLQVGRFCEEKNFAFTSRVAASCKRRGDRIRFWLVGNDGTDNPYEREVKQIIAAEGLEEYVRLLGVRKDVSELMKEADAFILPSKYEGMPLTLIEAQAACLPCVAADTFSHEVDFGVDAIRWMAKDASVDEWADAVEYATRSDKIGRDSVKAAIATKGFDVKAFSDKICSLYLQAVKE